MTDILIRAGCFIAVILLGILLRRVGLFQRSDFSVLSKIVLKLTLPASIVASFTGKRIDPSLLSLALLGLVAGVLYMGLAMLLCRRGGREQQAFGLVNLSGYNIGCFTLPFVQTFLGPAGVITVSLFDIGNACICLGTSYSLGKALQDGTGFSWKRIGRSLVTSVPLICYILMTLLCLTGLSLPAPIVSLANIIGSANPFLAMFMIGVGFELKADRAQTGRIFRHLAVRYGVAALFALLIRFVLPFEESVRQVLVLLVFSPIGSAAPAYTGELEGDVGLSSAINSIAIIISIVIMVTMLVTMF